MHQGRVCLTVCIFASACASSRADSSRGLQLMALGPMASHDGQSVAFQALVGGLIV